MNRFATHFRATSRHSRPMRLFALSAAVLLASLAMWLIPGIAHAAGQIDIPGPAGSGRFGNSVAALPNGNFVVTDPFFDASGGIADVGAVYLYDGATHEVISVLTGSTANDQVGSGGVAVLSNGNFVVLSPQWTDGAATSVGAATWMDAGTGVTGTVSAANSLIGSAANDQVGYSGVTALPNGNYLVASPFWTNGGAASSVGAVTWGNGATGITGVVSSTNSLVGSTGSDSVGGSGITVLTNGNYVVRCPYWNNGAVSDAGAVTWGNGATGTSGVVGADNSLVGTTGSDRVGYGNIAVLTNGNYAVSSYWWNNGVGAATWGDGAKGITGTVSINNSLIGNATWDYVSDIGIVALTNGNYVVVSRAWKGSIGAVTWSSGTRGITGTITISNSLIGSTANDSVGYQGVQPLKNGNYVVLSSYWKGFTGAATWGNGETGITGTVGITNSLVGAATQNWVGYRGVTALTNGNYVINSARWDNGAVANVGAVTWANGATGITGTIGVTNSLIGSTTDDYIGGEQYTGVFALTNGNYVVVSPKWNNGSAVDAGAITWGNGATGTSGVVSATNSLVGSTANDTLGLSGLASGPVAVMSNGNYAVMSSSWSNGAATSAGAVTWGNGRKGIAGPINAGNSLVGTKTNDKVGGYGVYALTNGNYAVLSPDWANGSATRAGALTWGKGTTGIIGPVSTSNSIVGGRAGDALGSGISRFTKGHYAIFNMYWTNGVAYSAGAMTVGTGVTPITGTITSANSVMRTQSGASQMYAADDPVNYQMIVGRPGDNMVTLFDTHMPPLVEVSKQVVPESEVGIGAVATYTLVLENVTESTDQNVFLTDTLPVATTFAQWGDQSGAEIAGNQLTWRGALTVSMPITISFQVTNTGCGMPITNTALYSGTYSKGAVNATYTAVKGETSTQLEGAPTPSTYGQLVTFTATVTSTCSVSMAGGQVTFKDGATTLGNGTLDANGVATYTTGILTRDVHTMTAYFNGTTSLFASTSGELIHTVEQAGQTITFDSLANKVYGADAFTVTATASSGLTVAFTTTTPSVCGVSGTTVNLLERGICTVRASQPGDNNYLAAADVDRNFNVDCGDNVVVDTNADSGYRTLRGAIANLCDGGTVSFSPALDGNTIALTSGEIEISGTVSVVGLGAGRLAVSGGGISRVFNVTNTGNLTLTALTVRDGYAGGSGVDGYGGGIINSGQLVLAVGAIVSNSASLEGGGIQNLGGKVTLIDSLIVSNTADSGGGLYNSADSTLILSATTVATNTATGVGGGIVNMGANGVVEITAQSLIQGNIAGSHGGGIANDASGKLMVSDSTVGANTAAIDGGGIHNSSGDSSVAITQNSQIQGNVASGNGGAIYSDGVVGIEGGSTLTGNRSEGSGGGIYSIGPLTITAGSLISNTAPNAGAQSGHGGAIYLSGADRFTIDGSSFAGNQAQLGGALYITVTGGQGESAIINSQFQDNRAAPETTGRGGGIYINHYNTITISGTTMMSNAASAGGGIYVRSIDAEGVLNIVSSGFVANDAPDGGALLNYGELSVRDTIFTGNSASNGGGAIHNRGPLTITASTFMSNRSDSGGAISNGSALVIANSTFADNVTTGGEGGGLYNSGNLALIQSTFSNNRGGVVNGGTLNFTNTIIANSVVDPDCSNTGTIEANTWNLVEDGACTPALSGDPLLGELGDFGGATWTLPLLPGSNAIDNGNVDGCLPTDQRGVARTATTCDIGAFESQGFVLTQGGGDQQRAPIDMTFSEPLSLTVAAGNWQGKPEPVVGGQVIFVGPGTGAGVTPITKTAEVAGGGATATVVTANSTAGAYSVTVSLAGGNTPISYTLSNFLPTTTTVTTAPPAPVFGQVITFTAGVTAPYGAPTGAVTFTFAAEDVVAPLVAAMATITRSDLTVGDHVVVVLYGGDGDFNLSQSGAYTQTVLRAGSAITVTGAPNPSVTTDSVTFTATMSVLSPGAGIPTGYVTFTVGAIVFTSTLDVDGIAVAHRNDLPVGVHGVSAAYAGDANFLATNVNGVDHVVWATLAVQAGGTGGGALASEPGGIDCGINCSTQFEPGTVVTVTATPLISSTFTGWDGAIGGVDNPAILIMDTDQALTATFTIKHFALDLYTEGTGDGTVATAPAGSDFDYGTVVTVTATPYISSTFTGWSGDAGGTTNPVVVTMGVTKALTATFTMKTYVITPTAEVNGSLTPNTAQTVNYGADQRFDVIPDPHYHILDVAVDNVSIGAVNAYTFTNVTSDHVITAAFGIDTHTLRIAKTGRGVGSLAQEPAGAIFDYGTVVTLTATTVPTSTFTGWSGDAGGTDDLLPVTIDGNKAITATFIIHKLPTTTTLESSFNPSFVGENVVFAAQVDENVGPFEVSVAGGPTGKMHISDPTGTISATKTLVNGGVQLNIASLEAGNYSVTATYSGDTYHEPSVSNLVIQVVNKHATMIGLALSSNPGHIGDQIYYTATVAWEPEPSAVAGGSQVAKITGPTGSIDFLVDGVLLANAKLVNGVASIRSVAQMVATVRITANYLGDRASLAGASDAITLRVFRRTSAVSLDAAPNPIKLGASVRFTATVLDAPQALNADMALETGAEGVELTLAELSGVPASDLRVGELGVAPAFIPTGKVIFSDNGTELGRRATVNGVATLDYAELAAGSHAITARYVGDSIFAASTSAPYEQVVQPLPLAVNDAASMMQGETKKLYVLENDIDPAGGLKVTAVTQPAHGTVTIAATGKFVTFKAKATADGLENFTYTATDNNGNSSTALVSMLVAVKGGGQGAPQVASVDPTVGATATFTVTGVSIDMDVSPGFYTGTLPPGDTFFMAFTSYITPTGNTSTPPVGFKFGNLQFDLTSFVTGAPLHGVSFAIPITLTIDYDPALLGNLNPATLGLYHWDGSKWSTDGIKIVRRNVAAHKVTIAISHLSEFAFFAAPPSTTAVYMIQILLDYTEATAMSPGPEMLPPPMEMAPPAPSPFEMLERIFLPAMGK